jgi:oxygen-independent coproporphyrinogen-3 oxidase
MEKPSALYIHIPFCRSICSYCDFPKLLGQEASEKAYLSALEKELLTIPAGKMRTIYFGGGTPSALAAPLLKEILSFVSQRFGPAEEFSLEANPETVDEEKVQILKETGVSRVSLGAQSFDPDILKILGRSNCLEASVRQAVRLLQQAGITNLNIDFIYGLQAEKKDHIRQEIRQAASWGLKHLSAYALQIEKGTPLFYRPETVKDDDGLADDYDLVRQEAESAGFKRYEVSNFACPGFESRHNLTYWHGDPYYAAGLGAVSFVDGVRLTRTRNIRKYLAGDFEEKEEKEDPADQEFDFLMLNLRLEKGFALTEFQQRFHKDFLVAYQERIKKIPDLEISGGRVFLKPDSLYILDAVLLDLLDFKLN